MYRTPFRHWSDRKRIKMVQQSPCGTELWNTPARLRQGVDFMGICRAVPEVKTTQLANKPSTIGSAWSHSVHTTYFGKLSMIVHICMEPCALCFRRTIMREHICRHASCVSPQFCMLTWGEQPLLTHYLKTQSNNFEHAKPVCFSLLEVQSFFPRTACPQRCGWNVFFGLMEMRRRFPKSRRGWCHLSRVRCRATGSLSSDCVIAVKIKNVGFACGTSNQTLAMMKPVIIRVSRKLDNISQLFCRIDLHIQLELTIAELYLTFLKCKP